MADFAETIRHIRDRTGLSRRDSGERTGLSEGKVQKIEIGDQRADHGFLSLISRKTSVDVNWLLNDDRSELPEHFPLAPVAGASP